MINVRWGKAAHVTFFIFGIMTNIIVSSMLLLGGCAVMEAAAGIDIRLSGFLIPLGTLVTPSSAASRRPSSPRTSTRRSSSSASS